MSRRPWYPRYTGDYRSATADFTTEEIGAYDLLLDHYWDNQGPITSEMFRLRIITKLSSHKARVCLPKILRKFVLKDGKYFNRRMDAEIAKANDISGKRAEAAQERWDANAPASAKELHTQPQPQLHKSKIKSGTRRARIPADWELSDNLRDYCRTKLPNSDPDEVAESFKTYWMGEGRPKANWDAAFQTWVRRDAEREQKPKQTNAERVAESARRYIEDNDGEVVGEAG